MLVEQWHCQALTSRRIGSCKSIFQKLRLAMRSITEPTAPQPRASSRMLGRLTRLICFDRHNRFDHHDFRVMAAGTSTVWALYGQVAVPMRVPDAGRLPRNIFHPVQIGCELACSHSLSEDIQLPVCPSCAQNRWQHLNGTAYFLFAHSRPTCVSPSIRTMSESPSATAARMERPSDDQDTRRAMNVARSPKSVI